MGSETGVLHHRGIREGIQKVDQVAFFPGGHRLSFSEQGIQIGLVDLDTCGVMFQYLAEGGKTAIMHIGIS